jgi:hypothetical protein
MKNHAVEMSPKKEVEHVQKELHLMNKKIIICNLLLMVSPQVFEAEANHQPVTKLASFCIISALSNLIYILIIHRQSTNRHQLLLRGSFLKFDGENNYQVKIAKTMSKLIISVRLAVFGIVHNQYLAWQF